MHADNYQLYHFFNRGNNRQQIFFREENYIYFIAKAKRHLLPVCDILAWCLMPNHFHFLLHSTANSLQATDTAISNGIRIMLSSYTRAINNQEGRTGSLFQQNSKLKPLLTGNALSSTIAGLYNNYPLNCFNYIHHNPLKAGLVSQMEDWEYSSFQAYYFGKDDGLCNRNLAVDILGLPPTSEGLKAMTVDMPEAPSMALDDDSLTWGN